MKKLLIAIVALALLVFAAAAVGGTGRGGGDDTSTRTTSDDARDDGRHRGHDRGGHHRGRDDDDRREAGEDVRGPCDEAEHAREARCAGAPGFTSRSTTARAAPAAGASTADGTVRVTERSYSISFSPRPTAGRTTFVVRNASEDDHDFWLAGGGKTTGTRKLGGGGTQRLTVTLKRGVRYRFFCAVGSHAQAGVSGTFVAR